MKDKIRYWMKRSALISRVWNWVWSRLFFRQWIVLAAPEINENQPFWDNFIPFVPPPDRFWADPFIWKSKENFFIFVEEFFYGTNRGHIACLTLNRQLELVSNSVVLERPYHLSYPFVFEHKNKIYMLPETKNNLTIELYQCKTFPNEWVMDRTLMPNVSAVDSTLLEADGKWWLFTYKSNPTGQTPGALYLYHADQPTSEHWISHPQNPIVRDSRFARPAGRIFFRNGNLFRPSQDCSFFYGHAINLNRITCLTDSNYEETLEFTITPPKKTNMLATHTWNTVEGLHVTDALLYRWRLGNEKKPIYQI